MNTVICSFDRIDSFLLNKNARRCTADQKIESEDYFVSKEPILYDVEVFYLRINKYVKFLPRDMGEKFPNLKEFDSRQCSLTIIREFYLKSMRKLQALILIHNKIAIIEPEAFKDLVKVDKIWLHDNLIETLDEKLFSSMISLKHIYLQSNKIKFLGPETFKIPGASLEIVDLQENPCTGRIYGVKGNLNKLKPDLIANCPKK